MRRDRHPTLIALSCCAIALLFLFSCEKQKENQIEALLFGPDSGQKNDYFLLRGEINSDLIRHCGEVKESSGGSESSANNDNGRRLYTIESYFITLTGSTIFLRFQYDSDPSNKSFTLNPTTTVQQTCNTLDFINCNTTGTATCETADNIRCGGAHTMIVTHPDPPIRFQAHSGNISWDRFRLNDGDRSVQMMDLNFSLMSPTGSLLEGELYCQI